MEYRNPNRDRICSRDFGYAGCMAKTRKLFICRSCGATQHRWAGKCPDCGAWDSLEESTFDASAEKDPQRGSGWVEPKAGGEARKTALTTMARLIAPFTPHLAEEAWARLGEDGMVLDAPWPVFDAALAADDEVTLPVQIGGKRRGEVVLPRGSDNATVEAAALANPTVQAYLAANNLSVRKVIVVPDRIVNLVAG